MKQRMTEDKHTVYFWIEESDGALAVIPSFLLLAQKKRSKEKGTFSA